MQQRGLFQLFPEIRERVPWLPLADLPTPVERYGDPALNLWVKRDDVTARPYGGNKVRKLEFLLAAARAAKARRLITVGAAGSHHALATTIFGRQHGFDVTLVLFPQPMTDHVRNILLLDSAFGAELRYTRRMEMVPAALFTTMMKYRSQNAYVIPAGGSNAVGTLGYVEAGLELAQQIRRGELPEPASVVVAAGTLGTAAGLAIGFVLAGMKTTVRAVRITSRLVTNERALARLIRDTQVLLRRAGASSLDFADEAIRRVQLVHDYIGLGYGKATTDGSRATVEFAKSGLHLDPTYTAKAAAAFLQGVDAQEKPLLFWQTLSAEEPLDRLAAVEVSALPPSFRNYLSEPVSPGVN